MAAMAISGNASADAGQAQGAAIQVLVILASDGKPLPDSEGPIALRALGDLRPGPRHIHWLREIKAVRIE